MRLFRCPLYLLLLCIPLYLSGCSSLSGKTSKDLVRGWSEDLSRSERFQYPFLAIFQAGNKRLYYIASNHETRIEEKSLQLIKKTIAKNQIDVVLLEGFESELGFSPTKMRTAAEADGQDGFYKWGETTLTIQESLNRNIPFLGGEPQESQIIKAITSRKYSLSDLLNFYFVRQIPQMQRAGELEHKSVESLFSEFVKRMVLVDFASMNKVPNFNEFKNWYKEKNKEEFLLSKVDSETSAPFEDGPLFTQRISALIGRIRDEHVVTEIFRLLEQYDRILVVSGGSHFTTQQLALEANLGKATISSGQPKF